MPRPFLTAHWRNLGLITWDLDPADLASHLPPGCEPDTRDGRAFVSFVMFDFIKTAVLGVRWPGFVNFPEINLRCYVRHGEHRGVCFVRELVPRRLVAWIARAIYNEPYLATSMQSSFRSTAEYVESAHRFWFGGRWHTASVRGRTTAICPECDSVEHFFKEHSWGFGRSRRGVLRRYRVEHPVWEIYPDATAELDVDFARVYGKGWGFLNQQKPCSVVFAVGSEISVSPHADLPT